MLVLCITFRPSSVSVAAKQTAIPESTVSVSITARTLLSVFFIFFPPNEKSPLAQPRAIKITAVPPCFADKTASIAITGAPGEAYLSTPQLPGHVPLLLRIPFSPTGTR